MSDAVAWLRSWSPEGPWTVASIDPERPRERVPAVTFTDPVPLTAWIEERNGRLNLYFVVNVPTPAVTTTPTKAEIIWLNCLHSDLDLPKTGPYSKPTDTNFARLLARIRFLDPAPTAIVFSGGGYQAFWLFDEPLPAAEYAQRVEDVNRTLERAIDADNCHNINRLMRLPGTMNVPNETKRQRGRVPTLTYVVDAHWDRRWSFSRDKIPTAPPEDDSTAGNPAEFHVLASVPVALQRMITGGDASKYNGNRSDLVYAVIHWLLRLGWSDEEVRPYLLDPAYKVSSHCLAQTNPQQYVTRQLIRARENVSQDFKRHPKTNAVLPTDQDNLRKAIDDLGVKFEEDVFALRVYVNGSGPRRPISDIESTDLRWTIDGRFGFNPPKPVFDDFVGYLAHQTPRHPVREYLDALVWDGVPRLGDMDTPSWLTALGGAEDGPYTRAVGRLMLIAGVRRIREPGSKFDEMLVLISPKQGTNKSTAIKELCPNPEWFSANLHLGARNQEVLEQLSGKWILEFSELSGLRTSQVDHLKAFMSWQSDRARLAYGHFPVEALRQCVFFGTTNEILFLRDNENRRFWPVRVLGFTEGAIAALRDQLWAEAALAEARGESIRLDPDLYDAASLVQARHRAPEPWADLLDEHLGDATGKILGGDLIKLLNKPSHMATQEDVRRLAAAVREIGWEHAVRRFRGQLRNCYVKGTVEQQKEQLYVILDPVIPNHFTVSTNPDPAAATESEIPF